MIAPLNVRTVGPFTCTGGEAEFGYDFRILSAADLAVLRLRAGVVSKLSSGLDYTVSGVGSDSGGVVTLTAHALPGDVYLIEGARPLSRLTDLALPPALNVSALDDEYDNLQMQIVDLARHLTRCVRRSPLDAAASDTELPEARDAVLYIDDAGAVVPRTPQDVFGSQIAAVQQGVDVAVSARDEAQAAASTAVSARDDAQTASAAAGSARDDAVEASQAAETALSALLANGLIPDGELTSLTRLLDNIAGEFDGLETTFDLKLATDPVTPSSASQLLVVLGGIPQAPGSAFTVAGSQITFAAPPDEGLECFILQIQTQIEADVAAAATAAAGSAGSAAAAATAAAAAATAAAGSATSAAGSATSAAGSATSAAASEAAAAASETAAAGSETAAAGSETAAAASAASAAASASLLPPPLSLWDFWIEQPGLVAGNFTGLVIGQFRPLALSNGTLHSLTSAMPDGPTGIGSGLQCFRSGTAVDSGSIIQTPRMNGDVLGAQSRKFRSQLMWHDDIADSFVRCGAMSGASANKSRSAYASAVYFEIDGSTCSAIATASTTHTVHPTTITLSQAVQYTFEIDIAADGSEARYRVWAGTSETPILDVTNTTNIPGLTGTLGWAVTAITKVAAAARNIATLYSIGYGTIAGYHRATGRV